MAQHEEPMDIDEINEDKENSLPYINVLSTEDNIPANLDAKTRSPVAPKLLMSKSYTDGYKDHNHDISSSALTQSFDLSLNQPPKSLPLQTISSDKTDDVKRSSSILKPRDETIHDSGNLTVTVSDNNENFDQLSLPSTSESPNSTPELLTPVNEIPRLSGSPIIRGLKSMLNMFRPSPSPIPGDEDDQTEETCSIVVNSPEHLKTTNTQQVVASTPLATYKEDKKSVFKEGVAFEEDLEKALLWDEETTIIFSKEKMPVHKLLFPPGQLPPSYFTPQKDNKQPSTNNSYETSEPMDISLNNSVIANKTLTEIAPGEFVSANNSVVEKEDSIFLDCETTFNANETHNVTNNKLEDIFEEDAIKTTPEIISNKAIEKINCDPLSLEQDNRNATIMNNNDTFEITMNQTNTVDQLSATKDIIEEIDSLTQDQETNLQEKCIEPNYLLMSSSGPNQTMPLQNESNHEEPYDKPDVEINNTCAPSLLTEEISTKAVVKDTCQPENISETILAAIKPVDNNPEMKSEHEICGPEIMGHITDSMSNSLCKILPCETNTDIKSNENTTTSQQTVAEMNEEAKSSAESNTPDKSEKLKNLDEFETTLKDTSLEVEQPKEVDEKAETKVGDSKTKFTPNTDIVIENKTNEECKINLTKSESILLEEDQINLTISESILLEEDQIKIVTDTDKIENISMELSDKKSYKEETHKAENVKETTNKIENYIGNVSNITLIPKNNYSQHEMQEDKDLFPTDIKSFQQDLKSNSNDHFNSYETVTETLINKADLEKELVIENSEIVTSLANTVPSKENMDRDIDKKQEADEEIIISENTSPFISLSRANVENIDTSVQEAPRSASPPIQVKNTSYDMNFDDIDDPFNMKSKNKKSMSPLKTSPKTKNSLDSRKEVTPIKGLKTSEKAKVVIEYVTQMQDTKSTPEIEKVMNATYDTESQSLQPNANKTYECIAETNAVNKSEFEMDIDVSMKDHTEEKTQGHQNDCSESVSKEVSINELSTEVTEAENATCDISKTCELDQGLHQTLTIVNDTSSKIITNATFETTSRVPVNPLEVKESNDFDDVNISKDSDKYKTDEEDTVEGPDIEKFLDDVDEQPENKNKLFNDQEMTNNEHNEEIFIDAEGFDFLMNQNNNEVIESGKESLFLKFDPLYANRVNSDGVVEALKNIRKRQSLRTKARQSNLTLLELSPPQASSSRVNNIMDDSIEIQNSSLAFPKKVNSESIVEVLKNMGQSHNQAQQTQQWEDNLSLLEMSPSKCVNSTANNNLMNDSFDEFNSTMIHKPTMAVPPAVNQISSNIRNTPSKPIRHSTAYMSPAIAVIDRLISISANNSYVNPDMTLTQDDIEREDADLVYSQFREMLTGKEVEVQNLKLANRELLNKLSTVESTLSDLEKESERKLKNINELSSKLSENTKANEFLQEAIAEYERTISYLVQEIEKDKQNNRKEKEKLIQERDEYLTHLSSVEAAFSDLHSKYEKSKQLIMTYKYQEQTQKRQIEESNEKVASLYKNYETLQQHASSKFEKAYNQLDKVNKQHESAILKIKTLLKRKDMDIVSLEESLAQKTKVNEELTSICDDLISKVANLKLISIPPPWQPNKLVAMATSDKHCQTISVISTKTQEIARETQEYARVMYDETVSVTNAREIESPEDSDLEDQVRSSMSKFNPPIRHTAKHHFDETDSDSDSEQEDFLKVGDPIRNVAISSSEDQSPDRLSSVFSTKQDREPDPEPEPDPDPEPIHSFREPVIPPPAGLKKKMKTLSKKRTESTENSDSDSNEIEDRIDPPLPSGRKQPASGVVIPAEDAYDPKMYQDLKVPPEIENIFQYIMKYTPQKIDIEFKLQPFVPEYVPAVGDIDAFIKVTTPSRNIRGALVPEQVLEHIDNLGLTVLDEPSAEQSDSALLHLQLRAMSKTSSAKSNVLTKKLENPEKNPKAIDRWIKDVSELHLSKPPPNVNYTLKMPDIDALMEEWPESIEETLNDIGFPPASLDCSLSQYVDLVCGIFDVPVAGDSLNDRIQALHVLFSLYSAVAERIKEEKGEM